MWTKEVEEQMKREISETREYYEECGIGSNSYSADMAVDEIRKSYHEMYDEEDDKQ